MVRLCVDMCNSGNKMLQKFLTEANEDTLYMKME